MLAEAAQQQQQTGIGSHCLVSPSRPAAASPAAAAPVRFCQQCGKAYSIQEFPPDPQQPDGIARLCGFCLMYVVCLCLSALSFALHSPSTSPGLMYITRSLSRRPASPKADRVEMKSCIQDRRGEHHRPSGSEVLRQLLRDKAID